MFLSRGKLEELVGCLRGMEDEIGVLRREIEDEAAIRRLERGAMDRKIAALEKKASVLDEFVEMDEEDRRAEKSFLQGLQNIMNFKG